MCFILNCERLCVYAVLSFVCECDCEREAEAEAEAEAVYFALCTFQLLTKLFLADESVLSLLHDESVFVQIQRACRCTFNEFYNMNGKHLFSKT